MLSRLICLLFDHADTEYGDVEAPYPDATFRHCSRCGREDPPPWTFPVGGED